MITAYIEGDVLDGFADALEEELEPRLIRAVNAGAEVLKREVRRLLSRAGDAAPGGPPAYRTGELHDAMGVIPGRKSGRSVRAGVGVVDASPAEQSRIGRKAAALEYGGTDRKGRYHPPYPFMRPAVAATESEVRAAMDAALEG